MDENPIYEMEEYTGSGPNEEPAVLGSSTTSSVFIREVVYEDEEAATVVPTKVALANPQKPVLTSSGDDDGSTTSNMVDLIRTTKTLMKALSVMETNLLRVRDKDYSKFFGPSKTTIVLDDRHETKKDKCAFDMKPSRTIEAQQHFASKEWQGSMCPAFSKSRKLTDICSWLENRLEPFGSEGEAQELDRQQYIKPIIIDYDIEQLPCHQPLTPISTSTEPCDISDELERTLVLIKPIAMQYKDVILKTVFDHGFQVVNQRVVHLSPEQVAELYSQYYGSPSFAHIVARISAAPVLILSLAAINAVQKWQNIIGLQNSVRREWFYPFSARKNFGLVDDIPNAIDTSENRTHAKTENRYFFPDSLLDPIENDLNGVTDYCDLYINKTLTLGLTEIVMRKPTDPIKYLAAWILNHNPFEPRYPCDRQKTGIHR